MKLKLEKGRKYKGISLFIKLDKSEQFVLPIIKSFKCYYHVNDYMWELPKQSFPIIVDKCSMCNIQIYGTLPKEYDFYLQLLDKYDKGSTEYNSKTKPYSYQMDSFKYSLNNSKFLLGDEQGLGKTKQALDIAVSKKHLMKHCLIVCGVNELKWNWLNEISVHTYEKGHLIGYRDGKVRSVKERVNDLRSEHEEFFLITNIETLRDKGIQEQIKLMCNNGVIGMTIIDEIHKCKNPTSQQGKAIHCCSSYFKLALTGTPLMNNCLDLYNVLKWLNVENHSFTAFKNHYCVMGGFGGYEIVDYKNTDELQSRLDSCMLRRRKEDVLDLPPKVYTKELLEMGTKQTQVYNEIKSHMLSIIDKILLAPNPLTELTRLRQVTGNPNILTSVETPNIKFNRLVEIIEEITDNNGKVIVFSNWTKVINPAFELLQKYNPAIVTGEIKDNAKEIEKFKNDPTCKVILGTIPCLGTGFTLNEANTVIFLDQPWTYAEQAQAEDRCHRIGTKGTVNIINLICKNTVDEIVYSLVQSKKHLSDNIVDKKELLKIILEG